MDLESLRNAVLEKSDSAVIQAEEIGSPAMPVLLELLESKDAEIRDLALACLVLTEDDTVPQVLARKLGDDNEQVRLRALQSLRSRYNSNILQDLIDNLSNQDPVIRAGVARIVGLIDDESAMKPLRNRLADENDGDAANQMKLALARLGDGELKDEFSSRLDTPSVAGRYQAIRDLEYINDPGLASRLIPALDDETDAYEIGHPDEEPRFARVCDAAVNLIAKWFDKPFSFEADELNVYTEEEIEEAKRFVESLEK